MAISVRVLLWPERIHCLPATEIGAVVAGADISGLPGLGVVSPHPAEPKGAGVGAGLGAHLSVWPISGGAGLGAGVHVPGFDDVAEGVGHEQRLHPASVLAQHLALDRRVSHCHRHLADLSQVVRAIPPVKVETGRAYHTPP